MLYNLLIDWEDQTSESGIVEPLTVAEVKNYLRLEGFIDDQESLSTDFDDDNTLIADLITSARVRLEEYTGLSFVPKTWEIEFTNGAGNFVIPFGPVIDIIELKDSEGNTITSYKHSFTKAILYEPMYEGMTMQYEAGYTTLPKGLKEAMYKEVAYRYINRGDINVDGLSKEAMQMASIYKQPTTWLG